MQICIYETFAWAKTVFSALVETNQTAVCFEFVSKSCRIGWSFEIFVIASKMTQNTINTMMI